MTKNELAGSFWPTPHQRLLLQTVLLENDEAASAWSRLQPIFAIEQLEPGSYALLPLLYRRLDRLGLDLPFVHRLRGIYRRTWYLNHLQLERLKPALHALGDLGVDALVVDGWELASCYYQDLGLRQIERLDVLIHHSEVATALATLSELGWTAEFPVSDRELRSRHVVRLINRQSEVIGVHWRLFHEFVVPGTDPLDLRQTALHVELGDLPARMLGPADELLNICLSGARGLSWPNVRWIADAATVVQASTADLDWDRILRQAVRLRATLRLRDALLYLREAVATPIPVEVLEQIERVRPPRREILAHRAGASRGGTVGLAPESLTRYLRVTADDPLPHALTRLPGFLRDEWGLERVTQVPEKAIRKAATRLAALRPAPRP